MEKATLESHREDGMLGEPMCNQCRWRIHQEKPMPVKTMNKNHRTPITWISSWCSCPYVLPDKTLANHNKPIRLAYRFCKNQYFEPLPGSE